MRKVVFTAVLALLVFAATEILSFLGLSLVQGRWASYSVLEEQRQAILTDGMKGPSPERKAMRQVKRHQRQFGTNVLHPFLGFVSLPREAVRRRPDFRPGAANLGFPDNRFSLVQKPSEEKLVVGIFGGSVANILANVEFDRLTQELGQIPRFAGKKIIIVHAALGGFKQPQQLMALNYFLALGGRFDVVINIDGFNEIALPGPELVSKEVFAHYPRDWYFRTAGMDSDLRLSLGLIEFFKNRRISTAKFFSGPLLSRSFTGGLLWTLRDQHLDSVLSAAQLDLLDKRDTSMSYQTRGPRRIYPTSEDLYRDLTAVWIRSSRQMHGIAQTLGAEYYHFLQPNQYFDGSKVLTQEELDNAFDAEHRYRTGVLEGYQVLLDAGLAARAEGLPFFDLTQIFREESQTLYTDTCCHFNLEGNRILGQAIVEAVAAGPPSDGLAALDDG